LDQDGHHIFIARETDAGATIFRVDALQATVKFWRQVRPADPAGILSVSRFFVTPSGNAYGYSESRILSACMYIRKSDLPPAAVLVRRPDGAGAS